MGSAKRIYFLDNLRWLFVLGVVMEHASNAYKGSDWWPVSQEQISQSAVFASAFTDAFLMPSLFYISGYFALPSIMQKGPRRFLSSKLKRLGLPWLLCSLFICPILPLIFHYTRNGFKLTASYWDTWLDLMAHALRFDFGFVVSMQRLMQENGFYQRYMWFLSLLLVFFFIFAAVYYWKKNWFEKPADSFAPKKTPSLFELKAFALIGGAFALGSSLIVAAILFWGPKGAGPEPLLTLGNLVQFRPSRLVPFGLSFILGVMSFRNRWFERGGFCGRARVWGLLFSLTLALFFYALTDLYFGSGKAEGPMGLLFFISLNFLTIATLGLFLAIARDHWNRPTLLGRRLAANSYNIYLSHYPIVLLLQLALARVMGLGSTMKFVLVSVISIFLSYMVSRYLLQPHPRWTVGLLSGLFILMILFVRV